MKKCLYIFVVIFTYVGLYSQTYEWAEIIEGVSQEYAYSIAVDGTGNVYVAGKFSSSTLTFNNGKTLTNNKSYNEDAYIAKFNSDGICQWAEKISGTRDEAVLSIVVDATGNVYVAGAFSSYTLMLNNGKTLTKSGYNFDAFIAKYNNSGVCQWAENFADASAYSITMDTSGNVYVVGNFVYNGLSFNNGISLINSGGLDTYFAKFNSDGICNWAEKIAGTGNDYGNSIAVDDNGNVYVSGDIGSDTLSFNNGITLSNIDRYINGYITKYNNNGTCQWAEKIAGTSGASSSHIEVHSSGSVFVAGYFDSGEYNPSTLTFNNGKTLTTNSYSTVYLAKYNSSGFCQWAEKIAGVEVSFHESSASTDGITIDSFGNLFVSGTYYTKTLMFNNGKSLTRSNEYYLDAYFAKYNSNGVCQWAEKIAGTSDVGANCLVVDSFGNLYVAGNFNGDTLTFNNGKTLSDGGYHFYDVYIAKYSSASHSTVYEYEYSNSGLMIFPNPCGININIKLDTELLQSTVVSVFDLLGLKVLEQEISDGSIEFTINIEYLPEGIYYLKVNNSLKKFVKL